jgi:hypothetical protein
LNPPLSPEQDQEHFDPRARPHPLEDCKVAGERAIDNPQLVARAEFMWGRRQLNKTIHLTRADAIDHGVGDRSWPLAIENDAGDPY